VADDPAVTFVPESEVRAVTIYSEDGEESQQFSAGEPVVDVPKGVLKRIRDADKNVVDGYAFEVGSPKTAERKHGAPTSAEEA
jgi:hypothetical protein